MSSIRKGDRVINTGSDVPPSDAFFGSYFKHGDEGVAVSDPSCWGRKVTVVADGKHYEVPEDDLQRI